MRVEATKRLYKEVDDVTLEEINAMAADGWDIQSVDDKEVIGRCEGCSGLICEGDEYVTYSDGVYLCSACK